MKHKILLQVAAPAILTGLVLVGTSLGAAWSIQRLRANLGSILSENVTSVQASLDLENSMRQLRFHSFAYLIRPTAESLAQIEADEARFAEAFARAEESANTPEEEEIVEKIGSGFAVYKQEMAQLRAEVSRTGPLRIDFAQLAREHPIRNLVAPCQELGKLNLDQLEQTAADSNDVSERWRTALLLLGIAGPLGGVIAGYGITRGLTRSITKLRVRVRDVADRLQPRDEKDGIQLTLTADGDFAAIDRQLDQVVHRAEEMMRRMQRQQREILRSEQLAALGQLAASVAHEVRNPLTGMKLLVEAALRPARPQALSREDLEVIRDEITRLDQTVQHFLDFARPAPLVRRVTDLREVVTRPVELVRARARQQQVEVRAELPDEPVNVDLDAGQLGTVVVNLLLNALDALPRGGRVNVEVRANESECRLRVSDTGPGIPPELLPRLFTPFASGKATGTGLGLSLARRIVEEHGGTIEAANAAEGGACFTITLPRAWGPLTPPSPPSDEGEGGVRGEEVPCPASS
jgi:signal transduction histidine kinase